MTSIITFFVCIFSVFTKDTTMAAVAGAWMHHDSCFNSISSSVPVFLLLLLLLTAKRPVIIIAIIVVSLFVVVVIAVVIAAALPSSKRKTIACDCCLQLRAHNDHITGRKYYYGHLALNCESGYNVRVHAHFLSFCNHSGLLVISQNEQKLKQKQRSQSRLLLSRPY